LGGLGRQTRFIFNPHSGRKLLGHSGVAETGAALDAQALAGVVPFAGIVRHSVVEAADMRGVAVVEKGSEDTVHIVSVVAGTV
jgi:hypothetical protein